MARAAERLRELTGENVLFLEDEVAATAKKHFPSFQQDYSSLGVELATLHLSGASRADDLSSDLAEVVRGDGSDAVCRLGGQDSPLFDSLKWALKVKHAFANGLKQVVASLQDLNTAIHQLPDSGVPGQLKLNTSELLVQVNDVLAKESFYEESSKLHLAQQQLEKIVGKAVGDLEKQQTYICDRATAQWQLLSDWTDLLSDDRSWFFSEAETLKFQVPETLGGLRQTHVH